MSISWIAKTDVQDGEGGWKKISVGDKVELLPPELPRSAPYNMENQSNEDSEEKTTHFNFLLDWLGKSGPFTVARIGLWPCGGVNLYLNGADGTEPGVSARDLKCL